ncbi:hypothetical protein MCEMSE15_01395 [Fimbriimonadaceae bacterium]
MRNFYIVDAPASFREGLSLSHIEILELDAARIDVSYVCFVVPYVDLERPMDWISEQSKFWESVAIKYWEFGQLKTHGYPSLWDLGYPKANPAKFFPLERSYVQDAFLNLASSAWWFEIRFRPDLSPLHAFSMDVCDLGIGIMVAGTSAFIEQLQREVRVIYDTCVVKELPGETPSSICSALGIVSF